MISKSWAFDIQACRKSNYGYIIITHVNCTEINSQVNPLKIWMKIENKKDNNNTNILRKRIISATYYISIVSIVVLIRLYHLYIKQSFIITCPFLFSSVELTDKISHKLYLPAFVSNDLGNSIDNGYCSIKGAKSLGVNNIFIFHWTHWHFLLKAKRRGIFSLWEATLLCIRLSYILYFNFKTRIKWTNQFDSPLLSVFFRRKDNWFSVNSAYN